MDLNFKPELKQKIKQALIEWIQDSTSHGIPKIFKNQRIFLKCMWLLFTLVSTGGCSYLVAKSIMDYSQFNVTTVVRNEAKIPLEFPAIAICNSYPFLTKYSDLFIKDILTSNGINDVLNSSFFSTYFKSTYQIAQNLQATSYLARLNAMGPNVTDQMRMKFAYSFDDVITSCFFAGQSCQKDDLVWFYDVSFGNCYKFNSGENSKTFKQTKIGNYNGLRLELFNRIDENITMYEGTIGFRVIIFDPSSKPNHNTGIEISTQTQTNVILSKIINDQLEKPYSDCINDLSGFNSDIYKATLNYTQIYSRDVCFSVCFQNYLILNCNCSDPNLPYLYDVPFCLGLDQMVCDWAKYNDFYTNKDVFDKCLEFCPLECERISYEITTSSLAYPSDSYAQILLKQEKLKNPNSEMTLEKLKENIAAINIYYEILEVKTITELEKTDIIDLISNIAGILGLFLGISFLSFIEIFEILFEILFILFENRNQFKNRVFHFKK